MAKTTIKKEKKKIPIKVEDKKEIKTEYTAVFPTLVHRKYIRMDANYFGIKQYLRRWGLDLFKKVKSDEVKKSYWELWYYALNLQIIIWWLCYCIWWEKNVNSKNTLVLTLFKKPLIEFNFKNLWYNLL